MEPAAVTDMHPVVIVLGDGGGIDGYPGKGGEFLHQEDHRQGVRSVRLRADPDITGRDRRAMLTSRFGGGLPGPVQDFLDKGADFVTAPDLDGLVAAMNELTGGDPKLDATAIEWEIRARDADVTRPFGKDFQAAAIRLARSFLGDRPDAGGTAARAARPGGRAADRGPATRAHPQDARRPAD